MSAPLPDDSTGTHSDHCACDTCWPRPEHLPAPAAAAVPADVERDATRYRWIRDTFHAAQGGASLEVNRVRAYYETPEPGKEVEVQWYPNTPIGFYKIEAATLDEAIDKASAPRPATP